MKFKTEINATELPQVAAQAAIPLLSLALTGDTLLHNFSRAAL